MSGTNCLQEVGKGREQERKLFPAVAEDDIQGSINVAIAWSDGATLILTQGYHSLKE